MIECVNKVSQRRPGWISTAVLVLFAFLIILPFAGQSVALPAHSNTEMATGIAPLGNLNLKNIAASRSHDHHKLSRTREVPVSHSSKLCVSMGHVTHKTHICCFDGTIVDRTIMRRDFFAIKKLTFASSSKAPFGLAVETKRHVLPNELQNAQSATPQLMGLNGAKAQFLRTQRLLT